MRILHSKIKLYNTFSAGRLHTIVILCLTSSTQSHLFDEIIMMHRTYSFISSILANYVLICYNCHTPDNVVHTSMSVPSNTHCNALLYERFALFIQWKLLYKLIGNYPIQNFKTIFFSYSTSIYKLHKSFFDKLFSS